MKKLLINFSILIILMSCSDISNEINISDIKTTVDESYTFRKVNYHGVTHNLGYKFASDSTLLFVDLESEKAYKLISKAVDQHDEFVFSYSMQDTTTYLFDDKESNEVFLRERFGFGKNKPKQSKVLTKDSTGRINEAISGIYKKDSAGFVGQVQSFQDSLIIFDESYFLGINPGASSDNSYSSARRVSGVVRVPGSELIFYEHPNYGGSSYSILNSSQTYQESLGYTVNLTSFNDKASSMRMTNESTRYMLVSVYQDYNRGGKTHQFIINPRNGSNYYGFIPHNLGDWKLCGDIFCTNMDDKISSVNFYWTTYNDASPAITVNNLVNTQFSTTTEGQGQPLTSLQKTIGTYNWDSGASSYTYIHGADNLFSGTGFYEFEITSKTTNIMVGASSGPPNNNASWDTIEYNLYVSHYNGDVLQLYNNGSLVMTYPGTYDVGDIITIYRQGSYVNFYKNASYIGRIPSDPTTDLYFDCSIWSPYAYISKVTDY